MTIMNEQREVKSDSARLMEFYLLFFGDGPIPWRSRGEGGGCDFSNFRGPIFFFFLISAPYPPLPLIHRLAVSPLNILSRIGPPRWPPPLPPAGSASGTWSYFFSHSKFYLPTISAFNYRVGLQCFSGFGE